MKKTFTILLFLAALATMSFVITPDEPPLFKNLKVLPKNTTKDQMDSLMHHFAGSMGKKCNFCHVYNEEQKKMDFASDAKEQKETARAMWKMTVKLNKKFFEVKESKALGTKLEVTCYTCHRGSTSPETKTPARPGPPPGGPGQQAPPPGAPATPGTDTTKHQ